MRKQNEAEAHWEKQAAKVMEELYDSRPKSPCTPDGMTKRDQVKVWGQWAEAYAGWYDEAWAAIDKLFQSDFRLSDRAIKWAENEVASLFSHDLSPEFDEIRWQNIDLKDLIFLGACRSERMGELNQAVAAWSAARSRIAARRQGGETS